MVHPPHADRSRSPLRRVLGAVALVVAVLAGPASVTAAPAGAGAPNLCDTNATYAHVCGGYQSYVRRNPTTDELEYWALQSPFPRTLFNSVLGKSPESRRTTIRAYYETFSSYEADPASLTYWQGEILKPNGLRRLEAGLLGSYVGMIDGFLELTFDTELGRSPTIEEQTYWGTRVVATSRTKVAAEVSSTPEARRVKVVEAYQHELFYAPDNASRDYWAERLRTGTSFLEMRIALKYSTLATAGYCSSPAPAIGPLAC